MPLAPHFTFGDRGWNSDTFDCDSVKTIFDSFGQPQSPQLQADAAADLGGAGAAAGRCGS